jgi:Tfp pilus assembly ATPase PilU
MQTFDQALFDLFCAGQIGYSEALRMPTPPTTCDC